MCIIFILAYKNYFI